MNFRLQKKYREVESKETRYEAYRCEDAEYVLTGFGTSSRLCRAAVNTLRKEGVKAGLFRPITLWPFPYDALDQACRKAKRVLVVEMNAGQMIEDVKLALGRERGIDFYGKMGGIVPVVDEILERVKNYVR